jgi:AcrR family transcriptional regulator
MARPAKKPAAPKRKAAGGKAAGSKTAIPGGSAAGKGDVGAALRSALLAEMATLGWRDLTFSDIVAAAGVPLAEAFRVYQSKMGVLLGVVAATDRALLEGLDREPLDGSPRDRLFDLIMRRFDQHAEHKAAFSALLRDLRRHPLEAVCLTARIERSMALLLDLAGVPSTGLRGLLRGKALGALYFHVFGRWLKDESADSAATMALLDKRLEQVERSLGFIHRIRPRHRGADEADEAASAH